MPTIVWLLLWGLVLAIVAFFAVRELRSGRKGVPEFDRMEHDAVREAQLNRDIRGPNTFGGWGS